MKDIKPTKGEIVMYQPDETVRLEVRVEDETVWLTQQQMAELFLSTKQNVSLHINNIFREDELEENSVVKESLTTAKDGKKYRTKFYNLDVIISVGYRVYPPQSIRANWTISSNSISNAITSSIHLLRSIPASIITTVFWLSTTWSISLVLVWKTQARSSSPTSECRKPQPQKS